MLEHNGQNGKLGGLDHKRVMAERGGMPLIGAHFHFGKAIAKP